MHPLADGKQYIRVSTLVRDLEALTAKMKDGSVVLQETERQMLVAVLDLVNTRQRVRPASTARFRKENG